jgi:hypothetical protein
MVTEASRSFAEMAFGIGAFWTVCAKTTVTEKGELCFGDLFTCKDSGQYQVHHGDPVIKATGWNPQKRHLTQIGHKKH